MSHVLSVTGSQPKVLLAEDHTEFRRVIAERLRGEGSDVVEVADGATLEHELRHSLDDEDNPRSPDLVLSDIHRPGGSGLTALERLRRDDPMTPVILMTAFGDAETHLVARRLGANEVVDTPVRVQDLVALVRRYAPMPRTRVIPTRCFVSTRSAAGRALRAAARSGRGS